MPEQSMSEASGFRVQGFELRVFLRMFASCRFVVSVLCQEGFLGFKRDTCLGYESLRPK